MANPYYQQPQNFQTQTYQTQTYQTPQPSYSYTPQTQQQNGSLMTVIVSGEDDVNVYPVAPGVTVGEIAAALAINGEILQDTIAVTTPAAVGDFWHVSGFAYIDVPRGCCYEITVENASPQDTPATPNPSIDIRNLNVSVNKVVV